MHMNDRMNAYYHLVHLSLPPCPPPFPACQSVERVTGMWLYVRLTGKIKNKIKPAAGFPTCRTSVQSKHIIEA